MPCGDCGNIRVSIDKYCPICKRNAYLLKRYKNVKFRQCDYCQSVTQLPDGSSKCKICLKEAGLRICLKCLQIKIADIDFWAKKAVCKQCMCPKTKDISFHNTSDFILAQELLLNQNGRCRLCGKGGGKNWFMNDNGIFCQKCYLITETFEKCKEYILQYQRVIS